MTIREVVLALRPLVGQLITRGRKEPGLVALLQYGLGAGAEVCEAGGTIATQLWYVVRLTDGTRWRVRADRWRTRWKRVA